MSVIRINQPRLVAAICEHLAKEHKGLTAEARFVNPVVEAANLIVAAFARPPAAARAQMGLSAWLASGATGISSRTMARRLAPLAGLAAVLPDQWDDSHPRDPSDFYLCMGLLDAVPDLRPHLPAMAEVSAVWAALVGRWDELARLYTEEAPTGKCPKLYALMKEMGA